MADSFFGFNTSLTALQLDDAPDLDDEEEYDALNHETFGDNAFQGDWEEDHTRFAEVTESSRIHRNSYNSDRDDDLDFETSISQLVLEEGEDEEIDCVSQVKTNSSKSIQLEGEILQALKILERQNEILNGETTCSSRNNADNFKSEHEKHYSSSSVWSADPKNQVVSTSKQLQQSVNPSVSKHSAMHFLPPQIPKIPTVQELERDLIQKNNQNKTLAKDVKNNINYVPNQGRNVNQAINQQPVLTPMNLNALQQNMRSKFTYSSGNNKFPPGFAPGAPQRAPFLQPPQQQEIVVLRNNVNMPMMLGPRLLPPYILPNPHLLLAQNPRLVPPHMMRFVPPHPVLMQQQQQQQHHLPQHQAMQQNKMQYRNIQMHSESQKTNARNNANNNNSGHSWMQNPDRRGAGDFDEYAGLMSIRERVWLRNIQLIQLTTDRPHMDDYYYAEWLKKQEKQMKINDQPSQTKNGLKKDKQCREPFFANNRQNRNDGGHRDRKDSERDSIALPTPRVYVPLQFENSLGKLQCVSVTAPRKIIDLDIVSEPQAETTPVASHRDSRKTKKLLLELERLYLMALEIEELDSNNRLEEQQLTKPELLDKIMSSFLNENRLVNFMCIRKGKTLLLRILKHMNGIDHSDQLSDLWCRTVKSFATIVRRDQNDGLLVQMYPYFKKWISTATYGKLSVLISFLLTGNSTPLVKSSSRAVSPSSGKSILSVSLASKFGVSVISSILSHGEVIYSDLEEKEQLDWTAFIFNFMKQMTNIPSLENIPAPLEPLTSEIVTSILNRSTGLNIQDYASAKRILSCFQ